MTNKRTAAVKFLLLSAVGIFIFFIKIPLKGVLKLPVDHLITFVDQSSAPFFPIITSIFALYCVADVFLISKSYRKSTLSKVFAVFKALGMIFALMVFFQIGPGFFLAEDIAPYTSKIMTKSIAIILSVAIFLPFLVDFGLIDAVGIILRPVMRPLFKIPGRTAVVAAGAFLGNFSIGHISTNNMYKEGKLTVKESAIVATGLSTVSIGLMMLFAKLTGMMDRWLFYFLSSAFICYLVTIITVRLPPLSKKSDDYCPGVEPDPEPVVKSSLLKAALEEGIRGADKNILRTIWSTIYSSVNIIAGTVTAAMFLFVAGLLINRYTPLFQWLGMAFWPLLKLSGLPNISELTSVIGISLLDVIPAVMIGSAMELEPAARYFLATFPVVLVIFFGGFGTCLLSTDIPVTVKDLFLLWVLRMVLAIPLIGLTAFLFF